MTKPDYEKFFSSRVNLMSPSPIREAVSKIAYKSKIKPVISFAAGEPDPDVLPRDIYAKLASEIFINVKKIVNYSPAEGVPDLRDEIAKFMKEYESSKPYNAECICFENKRKANGEPPHNEIRI